MSNDDKKSDDPFAHSAKVLKTLATRSVISDADDPDSEVQSGESILLSRVPLDIASKYLGFSVEFLGEISKPLESFFKVDDDVPVCLLKSSYENFAKAYRTYGYTSPGSNEAAISRMLNSVLVDLVDYFRIKKKIELPELRLRAEKWLRWRFEGRKISRKMNYLLGADSNHTFFVVEVKNGKERVTVGLRQAYLYLKRILEEEADQKVSF